MTDRFDGRTALITGAGSGIGRATAELLAREGARVLVTDRFTATAQAVANAIEATGGTALAMGHDVREEAQWQAAIETAVDAFGPLRVLVNNAGVLPEMISLEETSLESWRAVTAVNLDGVFLGLKHGIVAMRESGGAIVNLGSIYASTGGAMIGGYGASKGGVVALTKSAAIECAQLGYPIRINAVCPGYIDTGMTEEVAQTVREDVREAMAKQAPMKRMGRPEEVAEAIAYLASDGASFVTGTELLIDGGYAAR